MPIPNNKTNQFINDKDTRVSVGIDFPLGLVPGGDGYFATTKTTIESVKTNIKLLLQTNQGDRLFQPNLGMNLKQLLFEQASDETNIQIENNIVDVFELWLPFVQLQNINIDRRDDVNQININIEFNISRAPNSLDSVQVTFDNGGDGASSSTTSDGAY
jgi:phage baseplate assembly protein W|tara:strand:- start:341 stop:817 length:477 start_codon:yes stop_codon:yes gene_type:complete